MIGMPVNIEMRYEVSMNDIPMNAIGMTSHIMEYHSWTPSLQMW